MAIAAVLKYPTSGANTLSTLASLQKFLQSLRKAAPSLSLKYSPAMEAATPLRGRPYGTITPLIRYSSPSIAIRTSLPSWKITSIHWAQINLRLLGNSKWSIPESDFIDTMNLLRADILLLCGRLGKLASLNRQRSGLRALHKLRTTGNLRPIWSLLVKMKGRTTH